MVKKNNIISILDKFSQGSTQVLTKLQQRIKDIPVIHRYGQITSAIGTMITASMLDVKVGDLCEILDRDSNFTLKAEILAIDGDKVMLLPYGSIKNVSKNYLIRKLSANGFSLETGDFLLGKIVDGFGKIQGEITQTPIEVEDLSTEFRETEALAPDSMTRPIIDKVITTGVAAIDMFATCGYGQRIGIFAKAGLGKTTLMGMILRNAKADVVVIGLIGERGREVREFIDLELDDEVKKKCVLVVSTSDKPPIEQIKCAFVAQTIAEYFRDKGKNVLLFVDSITRFARATREVGLSAGEPPTRSGYPPSSFLAFPRIMERAGNNQYGTISAFYTVLLETDNFNEDPIADEVKSILDGHIILSDKLAKIGHFPAIDPLLSLSRIADRIITQEHLDAARHARMLLAKYSEVEFLIRVGEYNPGNDKTADEAVAKYPAIMKLLKQTNKETRNFNTDLSQLLALR